LVFSLIHLTPQPPLHAVERGSFRLVFPLSTQWRGGQGVRFLKRCPPLSHEVGRGSEGGVLEKVSSPQLAESGSGGEVFILNYIRDGRVGL